MTAILYAARSSYSQTLSNSITFNSAQIDAVNYAINIIFPKDDSVKSLNFSGFRDSNTLKEYVIFSKQDLVSDSSKFNISFPLSVIEA